MGESADLRASSSYHHVPVLLAEILNELNIRSGGRYIDATVGDGGHAVAMLGASAPDGRLLGLDRDPAAVQRAMARLEPFSGRTVIAHASYHLLGAVARETGFVPADAVLFDLGYSSPQIDNPERGFTFRAEGPLDMRFDPTSGAPTAADLVNTLPEQELVALLWEYGEESHSRRIAKAIVKARPLTTTSELAEVVAAAVGERREKIHPATQTFQALRIAVNRELERLLEALPQALEVLRPGGRLGVIAFHSLEDRIVKQFLKREASDCICPPTSPLCTCEHEPRVRLVTRKPITPSGRELEANPRSRSAKLRVAEKLPNSP
ncbi:MAG: 16S rRNA (cytosine(1402)-N(4))-methyltransferase RsmH [Anaerolineales bacterium]